MKHSSFATLPPRSLFQVKVYRSNVELARCAPESQASAHQKRRSLVKVLSRSPLSDVSWEEDPRATGWYGLRVNSPTAIYHITVEENSGVITDD